LVDEHVESPAFLERRGDRAFPGRLAGDVMLDEDSALDRFGDLPPAAINIGHHDAVTAFSQPGASCPADPGGAAGYERHLRFHSEILSPRSSTVVSVSSVDAGRGVR
jgi:hypothetical protein